MSDERNFKLLMSRVLAGGAMSAYPPVQEWEKSAISWALAKIDELSELRAKAEVRAVPVAECKVCCGTGVVDDGEITHSECGIPFMNGPVKCVKDCPACTAPPAQAVSVPEGWKLVPIEPTDEMVEALIDTAWIVECKTTIRGGVVVTENKEYREQRYIFDGYYAMLKAAPEPPC